MSAVAQVFPTLAIVVCVLMLWLAWELGPAWIGTTFKRSTTERKLTDG